jgi:hypothetical protein
MSTPNAKISRSAKQYVLSRLDTLIHSPDKEAEAVHVKYFSAKRARTDDRWIGGVGASGKQPGGSAGEERSLLVDQLVDVEVTQGVAVSLPKLTADTNMFCFVMFYFKLLIGGADGKR